MKKNIPRSAGKLIQYLKEYGMNQNEIAEYVEVSPSLISQWKYGNMEPNDEQLESLRDLFKSLRDELNDEDSVEERNTSSIVIEPSYGAWLGDQINISEIKVRELAEKSGMSYLGLSRILSGDTSNPQRATREKIERALVSFSSKKDGRGSSTLKFIAPPSSDESFASGLPFTREEVDLAPTSIGIYVIYDRRGFPTYVGSGAIKSRLRSHREKTAFADLRVANSFSYYLVKGANIDESRSEARHLERLLIKLMGSPLLFNEKLVEQLSEHEE
jgi:transcriptional regulator with XRE-family HTH domain